MFEEFVVTLPNNKLLAVEVDYICFNEDLDQPRYVEIDIHNCIELDKEFNDLKPYILTNEERIFVIDDITAQIFDNEDRNYEDECGI